MSSLLDTMAGHLAISVAGQPALVRILLGVKIANWRHRRGEGKGQEPAGLKRREAWGQF